MADVQHKNLPDADLHEPKGVAAASAGTTYVADGAGSGSWAQSPYFYTVEANLNDVSAPSSAYTVAHTAGTIVAIYTVLGAAITGVDSTVTFYINGVAITGGTITVTQSGSAAGDVDSCAPSALRSVIAGNLLTATTDGASSTTATLRVIYKIKVS